MTIEIHQPQIEALILPRMASGQFESVEDLLFRMVQARPGIQEP